MSRRSTTPSFDRCPMMGGSVEVRLAWTKSHIAANPGQQLYGGVAE